jgi:hypothetical protein
MLLLLHPAAHAAPTAKLAGPGSDSSAEITHRPWLRDKLVQHLNTFSVLTQAAQLSVASVEASQPSITHVISS